MARRQRLSSCAMPLTRLPTSATSSAKGACFCGWSTPVANEQARFEAIDPTACHQSAHPIQQGSTVAFKVRSTSDDDETAVTVSEMATRHLRRLKTSASDYLGKTVETAVIAVPTNFSDAQRAALRAAAKDAGLEVLQFIHEPVAAVFAHDARVTESHPGNKNVVVVDIGGTRSDAAVVASRGGLYTMLATAHDYDVSGAQLDQVLVDHFAKEFLKKHKGADDPRNNARALAKLKLESEAAKKALSIGSTASFSVESLASGIDFTSTINRSRYELLASTMFSAVAHLATHVVEKAALDPLDVSEILLVGGSSHAPRVANRVRLAFPDTATVVAPSTAPRAINPSDVIARGAALQAHLVSNCTPDQVEQNTNPAVRATPHLGRAVGVLCIAPDAPHAVFHAVAAADTPLPVHRLAIVATPRDGGDVLVKLCSADRHTKVTPPAPKRKPQGDGDGERKADAASDDDEDDDDEVEDEERRERVWKIGNVLTEAAVRGTKKGAKVEVQIHIRADLTFDFWAREADSKGAQIASKSNGSA